jgi:hypothetical protein
VPASWFDMALSIRLFCTQIQIFTLFTLMPFSLFAYNYIYINKYINIFININI